ncbi:MAG: glycosyltransferase family 39 protein [Alphaproteobacteria bacterium]|nr:glycosyltransferase family 39 protein [Alphaproteobacteria bacterium]
MTRVDPIAEPRPASAAAVARVSRLAGRVAWDDLALALFVVLLILALATVWDYGVTWDEDAQNWYGIAVLDYYLSGFADHSFMRLYDLFYYGSIFDATAAALEHVSPFGTFETRHLLNALVGIVGIVGTWKLGRALGGPRVGFIAALFLALTPDYYGQMYNNPKDVPFAASMAWALYYLVRAIPLLPRPDWRIVVKLGLAAGLALAVRVGGLLIFGYVGLTLLVLVLWQFAEDRRPAHAIRSASTCFGYVLLPALAVAYPVMLLFWPWAQQSPVVNPIGALIYFSHEIFPYRTLFAGRYVPAGDLPWEYLPTYIVLKLPELVLALLAAAPMLALLHLRRVGAQIDRARAIGTFVLGFAIVFPVAYAVAIKAVLFDGMRHFIFVLPPIAVAAALAAETALGALAGSRLRPWVYGALALYGFVQVSVMALLHPDEYVYYNAFIGGTRGAQGLFQLDYWANSYAEDAGALAAYLRAEYGNDFVNHRFTVFVCGPPGSATAYFPPNVVFTPDRSKAEFAIAFTRDACDKSVTGRPIYRVERMGTLLSVVLDRRAVLVHGPRRANAAGGG